MNFSQKKCIPCKNGVIPLTVAEAEGKLQEVKGWSIIENGTKISRQFTFSNFSKALAFVNKVGEVAEAENHHPDIRFGWGYCTLVLQTHSIGGLHENDFIVAAKINALEE